MVSCSSTCSSKALLPKVEARCSEIATPSASARMLLRCSCREERATDRLPSSAERMRSSNQDWMPRLKKALANTATTMDGVTATTLNSSTSRTCSRAPAEPRRRSTHTRVSRPAKAAPSSSSTDTLASTVTNTRFGRSVIGAPPLSSTNVAIASVRAAAASTSVTTLPSRMSARRRRRDGGGCNARRFRETFMGKGQGSALDPPKDGRPL